MFSRESDDGVVRAVLLVYVEALSNMVPFITENLRRETLHVMVPPDVLDCPESDRVGQAETEEYVGNRYSLVRWSMGDAIRFIISL